MLNTNTGGRRYSVTPEGRYLALGASDAAQLVTGDTNKADDIFVLDVFAALDEANRHADLSATLTAAPDPATAGSPVTYTAEAANAGPGAASGVTLAFTLPAGLAFVSADPGCTPSGTTVTCAVGNVAAGASARRAVVATPGQAGSLNVQVAAGANEADPNSANNSASAATTVQAAGGSGGGSDTPLDLRVTLKEAPTTGTVDQALGYVVDAFISNKASQVKLAMRLPAGLTWPPHQGCTQSGSDVVCDLGSPTGAIQYGNMGFTVVPKASGSFPIDFSISTADAESNLDNNKASVNLVVTGGSSGGTGGGDPNVPSVTADLALKLTAPKSVKAGKGLSAINLYMAIMADQLNQWLSQKNCTSYFWTGSKMLAYGFTVQNKSRLGAPGVTVTGTLGEGAAYARLPGFCAVSGPALTCNLGNLAGKKAKTFSVRAKSGAKGPLAFSASVAGHVADPNTGNNRRAVSTRVR